MKLTPVQTASLKRLLQYRTRPPTFGERVRLASGFMLLLLVPCVLAGYLAVVWMDFPGALLLIAGLYVGGVAREIGQQRLFLQWWPMNREITDWGKVEQVLVAGEVQAVAVDASAPPPPRKKRLLRVAAVGVGLFGVIFGAAVAVDRTMAHVYNPARNNPSDNVIILTASWCGYCMSLREHLAQQRIPYTDLDVEKTTEGRRAFDAVRGTGIPITIIGDKVIRGVGTRWNDWSNIDGALEAAGHTITPSVEPSVTPSGRS